jgi:uncharacterized protein YkwD
MASIFKGLAALIAVLTVNVGGAHVGGIQQPRHSTVTVHKAAAGTPADDALTLRGQNHLKLFPPTPVPTPIPTPVPVAAPVVEQQPAAAGPAPQPGPPAIVVGSTQQAMINQDRANAGLGPLTWNGCLAGIAYQNALRMANAGAISHAGGASADLGCGLGRQGGENVGYWSGGIDDGRLNGMFLASPGHRANIMGPYRYVGTSWVVARSGYAYIAVEFS